MVEDKEAPRVLVEASMVPFFREGVVVVREEVNKAAAVEEDIMAEVAEVETMEEVKSILLLLKGNFRTLPSIMLEPLALQRWRFELFSKPKFGYYPYSRNAYRRWSDCYNGRI